MRQGSLRMGLSKKRKVFIEEYLQCWNASEAARRAEYRHPGQAGHSLLKVLEIQEAIEARVTEKCMSANEVLIRLADMARSDIGELVDVREDGSWAIDWETAEGRTHLIKSVRDTKHGVAFELYDAQVALEKIGRAHGLFKERHELSGPGGGPIEVGNMTDDERIARIAELLDERSQSRDPSTSDA